MRGKKLNNTLASFAIAMENRLTEKQNKGYSGWDSKDFSAWDIPRRLFNKACLPRSIGKDCGKKCLVDIAIYAMFLWYKIKES